MFKLQKVTTATHCTLRPPLPLPVVTVLGFNYKTRMHCLTNWTILRPLRAHLPSRAKFEQSRAIRSGLVDDSTHFFGWFLRESLVKIRTSPLYSATSISDVFTVQIETVPYFCLRCIWPNDFGLGWFSPSLNSVNLPIRSRPTYLADRQYVGYVLFDTQPPMSNTAERRPARSISEMWWDL